MTVYIEEVTQAFTVANDLGGAFQQPALQVSRHASRKAKSVPDENTWPPPPEQLGYTAKK